jgi:hypothetical protein
MTTERQSESARINGAKSHGPISAEGKEKSSRNSLRHGCTATHTLLLACEDPGDLDRMLEKYNAMYKPTTLEEQDLVAEMCSARWRIRRATGIETALIDCEMVTEEPKLKQKFATFDTGMVLSSAFRSLADESHSMDLLTRYESRLRRIHKQAHAMLLRLRQERPSEPATPEPPPVPAPTPDLAPVSDAPEECAPPAPAAPPPAIPPTPNPEARCSRQTKILQNNHPPVQAKMKHAGRVGQAVRLPSSNENTRWQNEPAVRRFQRRFRSRRERKIFNAASSTGRTGAKIG